VLADACRFDILQCPETEVILPSVRLASLGRIVPQPLRCPRLLVTEGRQVEATSSLELTVAARPTPQDSSASPNLVTMTTPGTALLPNLQGTGEGSLQGSELIRSTEAQRLHLPLPP
jgi:hypothetical protein